MTISLGNAISCIKEDAHWVQKILIGGFLFVLSFGGDYIVTNYAEKLNIIVMFVLFILSVLANFYLIGFILNSMHKVVNSGRFQMIEWNEKNLLLAGLKNFFAILGYSILLIILSIGILLLVFIVGGIALFAVLMLLKAITDNNDIMVLVTYIATGLLFVLAYIYYMQFVNAAFACYFKTLKFRDLINCKKHYQIIKDNTHAAWTLIGKDILFLLACLGIAVLLIISVVGILLIPFVIFAAYFVSLNLVAQYAKEIKVEKYLQ